MITLTRDQRVALKSLYDRGEVRQPVADGRGVIIGTRILGYRDFRKTVQGMFGSDPCVLVPWCGMMIGIEADGYVHS